MKKMKKIALVAILFAYSTVNAYAGLIELTIDNRGKQTFTASALEVDVGSSITFTYELDWAALEIPDAPAGTYFNYYKESTSTEWKSGDGQVSYGDSETIIDYDAGYYYSSATFTYNEVGIFSSTLDLSLLQYAAISSNTSNTEFDITTCLSNLLNLFTGCTQTTTTTSNYEGIYQFDTKLLHSINVVAVDETATLSLFGLGLIGLGLSRRKKS
jgi:hypothetical protein